jgi:hypothetical protein
MTFQLTKARQLRTVRYSNPGYRATGYTIVKGETETTGKDMRTRYLEVKEAKGDAPQSLHRGFLAV